MEQWQQTETEAKRLYRSNRDKKIAGVCGGIAEYLDADPTVIRLLTALSILLGFAGVVGYLIAWVVVPERPWKPS